jgi:hypothetical protein
VRLVWLKLAGRALPPQRLLGCIMKMYADLPLWPIEVSDARTNANTNRYYSVSLVLTGAVGTRMPQASWKNDTTATTTRVHPEHVRRLAFMAHQSQRCEPVLLYESIIWRFYRINNWWAAGMPQASRKTSATTTTTRVYNEHVRRLACMAHRSQ